MYFVYMCMYAYKRHTHTNKNLHIPIFHTVTPLLISSIDSASFFLQNKIKIKIESHFLSNTSANLVRGEGGGDFLWTLCVWKEQGRTIAIKSSAPLLQQLSLVLANTCTDGRQKTKGAHCQQVKNRTRCDSSAICCLKWGTAGGKKRKQCIG